MLAQPLATSALTLAPQSRASSPYRSQRVGPHHGGAPASGVGAGLRVRGRMSACSMFAGCYCWSRTASHRRGWGDDELLRDV